MASNSPNGLDLTTVLPGLERLARNLYGDRTPPEVGLVRQRLDGIPRLEAVEVAAELEVAAALRRSGRAPQRIAVGVGSRGIANLPQLVKGSITALRKAGFEPFIVPAMGSHGSSTAEGQARLLADYGVHEDALGVPVLATMETAVIGEVDGLPVHMDRNVVEAGAVWLVARVKPHTDFDGPIESGLSKMCAIGLGKQTGARLIHSEGVGGLRDLMPRCARAAVAAGLLVGGLGVVENQRDETARVRALVGAEIAGPEEESLLEEARRLLPRIPFDRLDVLVVERMGKNISGTGMDTNVLNRLMVAGQPEPPGLSIAAIAVLDLTDEAHGNGLGVGLADFTTARLAAKLDLVAAYTNVLTAGIVGIQRGRLPIIMPDDRCAVLAAVACCGRRDLEGLRLAWIRDTLHTETLAVSRVLYEEAAARADLEQAGPLGAMPFDAQGTLRLLEAASV